MIEFTDHANRKIFQRNLEKKWILDALDKPDHTEESYGKRNIAYKKIGKLYLAVVFIKEDKNAVVITAHWESSFKLKKEV